MIKIKNLMISTIVILFFISLIGIASADVNNGSSTMSAYRTLPSDCIEPNTDFTITVNASNYGTICEVVETLCDGWTYTGSSLEDSQVMVLDNTVTFYLFGETNFTYIVQAPSDEDKCCTISGIIGNQNKSVEVDEESDNVVCTCPDQSSGSNSSYSGPSSTSTAEPTEESTVQPTEESTVQPTDVSTESSTEASPGGFGDNTIKEAPDEGSEEPDAIPGFTAMTMLIAAVIGIMFRSSTKK